MIKIKTILYLSVAIMAFVSCATASSWDKFRTERVESDPTLNWSQVSPGNSGWANLVRYHPTIPQSAMICPDMWNTYQTDNNGETWYTMTDYDGDITFFHIRDLYYSSTDQDFGLAVCAAELWMTKDLGKHWDVVRNCPWYGESKDGRGGNGSRKVSTLCIDPNNDNTWYVAGGTNVRGQEWLSCYKEMTLKYPHGFESNDQGLLWRTKDGGKSWEEANVGLDPKAQVGRIIVNPNNSKQVFASSNYGMFRSDDGGDSWNLIGDGDIDNNIIMDMDFYYNADTKRFILYVIDQTQYIPDGKSVRCTGGIFRSDDNGDSWSNISGDLGIDINRLSGGVKESYYKYLTRWFNEGELDDIKQTMPGFLDIPEEDIQSIMERFPELPTSVRQVYWMLSADPSREDALYIGMADAQFQNTFMPGRVWTTSDMGKHWVNAARLYPENWEDDKDYWLERGNPIDANMEVGHFSPHERQGLNYAPRSIRALDVGVDGSVMIISDHSTVLSTDHGKSWKQMDETYTPTGGIVGHGNSNLGFWAIAQDRRAQQTFIGSSEHFIWFPEEETYNGKMSIRINKKAVETVHSFAFNPYNVNEVYLSSGRQAGKQYLHKSEDFGENWARHGVATPASDEWKDDFFTNSLLIDPIDPTYMYHGITTIERQERSTEGGFFSSKDGGKTFQQNNVGLPDISRVKTIVFDPRDKSYQSLFISLEVYKSGWRGPQTTSGGLFFSNNRGDSWQKVELPSQIEGVQVVKFDHTNRMYISTGHVRGGGDGVWYSDDFGENWTQFFGIDEAEHIDISPFDNNMIAVSVCTGAKNPGFYITYDRGETWHKSNQNIVTPHWIMDIHFDIYDPGRIWAATNATGLYITELPNRDKIQVVNIIEDAIYIKDNKPAKFEAEIVNSDYAGAKIVWKSENESIATVDESGVVTPVGRGLVKIWASTEDSRFTDFSVVTVE